MARRNRPAPDGATDGPPPMPDCTPKREYTPAKGSRFYRAKCARCGIMLQALGEGRTRAHSIECPDCRIGSPILAYGCKPLRGFADGALLYG